MTTQARHLPLLVYSACLLVIGPVLPLLAQEVDTQPVHSARQNVPPKVTRYVHEILRRHDQNGDGRLQPEEWQRMQGTPTMIDHNQDGAITASELREHVMAYARARAPVTPARFSEPAGASPIVPAAGETGSSQGGSVAVDNPPPQTPAAVQTTKYVVRPSRMSSNLPSWFLSRDADGDRQLTLREFAADSAGRSREFERLDRNGDGMLTPQEVTAPPSSDEPSNR